MDVQVSYKPAGRYSVLSNLPFYRKLRHLLTGMQRRERGSVGEEGMVRETESVSSRKRCIKVRWEGEEGG